MADAMDLAQQREQDRERHINNAQPYRCAFPFSAKNVTHQSRKLAALRFRA
jgi:hypothetical protein